MNFPELVEIAPPAKGVLLQPSAERPTLRKTTSVLYPAAGMLRTSSLKASSNGTGWMSASASSPFRNLLTAQLDRLAQRGGAGFGLPDEKESITLVA